MAPGPDRLAELSEAQRQKLESILLDFDVSWTPDGLAERVAELPTDDEEYRKAAVLELVRIDLERQWKAGYGHSVENYLECFPDLGAKSSVAPELLLAEYQARQLSGEAVKVEEFGSRFPEQIARLKQLLEESAQSASHRRSRTAHTDTSRVAEAVETQAEPAAKSWSLPREFGRYRILKPLGEGGMGSVYLAHDTELDRQVALKVPKFSGSEDRQIIERFYREARAAAKLQNRHICAVHDVGEIDGVRYISMAYIEGRPLSSYIRTDRTQPERSVVLVVGRLARALQEAHALGIVHRDLKPANIMIDRKREPVIMDFGLARLERQGDSRLTQSGMVMGTPAYMPPEQVSGEIDRLGPATDIYSLGVILYELLTGRVPFEGSIAAVMGQIMTQQPPKPSEFRPDLDPRLERICLRMMAKRAEDRYASMQEVADALADYLKQPVEEGLAEDAGAGDMSVKEDDRQLENMFATQYARRSSSNVGPTETDPTSIPPSATSSWYMRPFVMAAIALAVLLPILFGALILLRTPYGTLRIDVEDPNLTISVDGREVAIEDSSEPIRLKAGSHRLGVKLGDTVLPIGDTVNLQMAEYDGDHHLEVILDGATLNSESFTIVKGDSRVITVGLDKETKKGTLKVDVTDPHLKVSIDDKDYSKDDLEKPQSLAAGIHRLTVKYGSTVLPLANKFELGGRGYNGEYRLTVSLDGVQLTSHSFMIANGGRHAVRVRLDKEMTASEDDPIEADNDEMNVGPSNPEVAVTSFMIGIGGKVGILVGDANPSNDVTKLAPLFDLGKFSFHVPAQYREITDRASIPEGEYVVHALMYPEGLSIDNFHHLAGLEDLQIICLDRTKLSQRALNTLPCDGTLRVLSFECTSTEAPNLLALSRFSKLEVLLVWNTRLTGRQVMDSDLTVLRNLPDLWRLNLNGAEITASGIDVVIQCPTLKWLSVANIAAFTDEELEKLRRLPLWYLNVVGTEITDAGMSSLNDFHDLERLEIEGTIVSDAGMRAIPDLVARLHVLALGRTRITDDGLRMLTTAGKLHYLTLGPRITDRGLEYLKNCPLGFLRATECRITDVGLRQIEGITTLRHLVLGPRAKISESALQEFRKKLPDCKLEIPQSAVMREPVDPADCAAILPPDAPPPAVAPFDAATAKQHQQAWADCVGMPVERVIELSEDVGLTLVLIPPGEFLMGTADVELAGLQEPGGTHVGPHAQDCLPHEIPQHCVKISQPFMLGRHEVTQAEWIAVMGSNPSTFQGNPHHPVENVSWDDLELFLNRLNEKYAPVDLKFVRPTEAQWECAARSGVTTLWPCGDTDDDLREYAWFGSDGATHPVGQLRANAWGLHDMLGNVAEWCEDGFAGDYYENSPIVDPAGAPGSRPRKVRRGGNWDFPAIWSRYAMRSATLPSDKNELGGFRLAAALLSR